MLDTATGVVRVANKQPGTDGPTGSQWEARRKPDQRARGARPAISYRTAGGRTSGCFAFYPYLKPCMP